MDQGDSWRNKGKIQVIAVIDVVIGVFFIVFYLYYAVAFLAGFNPLPAEELSVHLGRFLVLLAGVLVFAVNGWQIYVAVRLFKSLRAISAQEEEDQELDSAQCIKCGRRWFKTSLGLILVIAVKFFLLCLLPFGESNNFDFFLCLFEFIFRILGVYFVKEFLDDLLAEAIILTRAASVRSSRRRSSSAPSSPPPPPPKSNTNMKIEIPLKDFISNANASSNTTTTMKVTANATNVADNIVLTAVINTHQAADVQH